MSGFSAWTAAVSLLSLHFTLFRVLLGHEESCGVDALPGARVSFATWF